MTRAPPRWPRPHAAPSEFTGIATVDDQVSRRRVRQEVRDELQAPFDSERFHIIAEYPEFNDCWVGFHAGAAIASDRERAACLPAVYNAVSNLVMNKRLQSIGNSSGIIIDKPILELLKITAET